MISSYLFVGAVGLYTLIAAVTDLRRRKIPNWLTVPCAISGLLFHAFAPTGWGVWTALGGFAVGFVLLLLPFLLGGGGAGDVKLLAGLGTWLGPKWLLIAFVFSVGAAAALALGVLLHTFFRQGMAKSRQIALNEGRAAAPIRVLPLAVPVALCTWCVLAWLWQRGIV